MNRSMMHLLMVLLGIATALTLTGASVALTGSAPPVAADDAGLTARRFYDAVNNALSTGSTARLESLLAPEIAVGEDGGEVWSHDRLVQHIAALDAAAPDLYLHAEEIVADDDQAVARVTAEGLASTSLLGVPSGTRAADRVRFVDGQVVAYSGLLTELRPAQPVIAGNVALPREPASVLGIARATVQPDATIPTLVSSGSFLVTVEQGEATVRINGAGEVTRAAGDGALMVTKADPSSEAMVLGAGESIEIDPAVSFSLSNEGSAEARILAASIFPATALTRPTSYPADRPASAALSAAMLVEPMEDAVWPAGIHVEPLGSAHVETDSLGSGAYGHLRVSRFMVPSAELTIVHSTDRPTLFAVESGQGVLAPIVGDGEPTLLAAGDSVTSPIGDGIRAEGMGDAPFGVLVLTVSDGGR